MSIVHTIAHRTQYFERMIHGKIEQTFNVNRQLSKYAACQTQFLVREPFTFKGKCAVTVENFICNLLTGQLIKMIF